MKNKITLLGIMMFIPVLLLPALAGYAQRKPMIGVASMTHESNSFSTHKTTLEDYNVKFGEAHEEIAKRFAEMAVSKTSISGYIEGAKRFGLDLYPAFFASASAQGPILEDAFNTIVKELITRLQEGPKLDGILLHLHGAMTVVNYPSGDEEIVNRVRKAFGPAMPIIVTHDFHANITPKMIETANVVITYKENPHLDTWDRGIQAAEIMSKMVKGQVKPVQVIVKPPMMYNIVFQNTFTKPMLPIVTEGKRVEKMDKVLAVSVQGGYQYGDVPWMGPSVVVVTDNDKTLAQREADRLAKMLWDSRFETVLNIPKPAEAVKMAMEHQGRPVVLLDMGDNIGGGSNGDSTFILEELLKQKAQGFVMTIADPEAYSVAEKAGVGNPFDFSVGGKIDNIHGKPVHIKGEVRSLNVGKYLETEIRHGGRRYWNMGHTAVIQLEGSTLDEPNLVLLSTEAPSPNSAHHLISNGVYVERQKIIVVKGTIAPRVAYEPFASLMIPVDSPGATAVNPTYFEYKNIRKGLFGMPNNQ